MSRLPALLLAASLACTGGPPGSAPESAGEPATKGTPMGQPGEPGVPTTGVTPHDTSTTDASTSTTAGTTGETASSGADASSGAEATTGPPPMTCGDGIQDPWEECDLSYQYNRDDGACTSMCKKAVCGDHLVWKDHEICDQGPENNDNAYSGCTEACVWGPRCNDGIVQPEEECEPDPDQPEPKGMAKCVAETCRFAARLVFVTKATYSGALGGLALADQICADTAAGQGFDSAGSFKAWLGAGVGTGALQRFPKAAVDWTLPYAMIDGRVFADNLPALMNQGAKLPLDVTETGETLPPKKYAWTNMDGGGHPFSITDHCNYWTSTKFGYETRVGKISPETEAELADWTALRKWTSDSFLSCLVATPHLYCFED